LGSILKVLPAAVAISAQLLLAEKSSVLFASALLAEKTETLPPPARTMIPIQTIIPSLGWNHYGIND
jgi:hypothetical protein